MVLLCGSQSAAASMFFSYAVIVAQFAIAKVAFLDDK